MDEFDTVKAGEETSKCMVAYGREFLEDIGEDEFIPYNMEEMDDLFVNINQKFKAIREGYSFEGQPGEFDIAAPYFAFDVEGNLFSIEDLESYLETTVIGEDIGDFMEWCAEKDYI